MGKGSSVKWRSAVHMDDGAGLPISAYEWNLYVLLCVCMCLSMLFFYDYLLFNFCKCIIFILKVVVIFFTDLII